MKYTIYTDGSHLKHTSKRLGVGGVMVDESDNIIDEFSEEVSIDFLKTTYGTSDVSNPTCEMLAALFAIKKFGSKMKPGDEACIKADYTGVMNFNTGVWKARLPYIILIRDEIQNEIKKQKLNITFGWVKGHQAKGILSQDSKWNNYVDLLAKGEK